MYRKVLVVVFPRVEVTRWVCCGHGIVPFLWSSGRFTVRLQAARVSNSNTPPLYSETTLISTTTTWLYVHAFTSLSHWWNRSQVTLKVSGHRILWLIETSYKPHSRGISYFWSISPVGRRSLWMASDHKGQGFESYSRYYFSSNLICWHNVVVVHTSSCPQRLWDLFYYKLQVIVV